MKHYAVKLSCFIGIAMFVTVLPAAAQDTVHISLPDAESQFLQKNMLLLAEKYNIDISKAQVIQAKLFDNPTLSLTGNLYDPKQKKVFNVSNNSGQYDIALQQLIRLAGKRNKEVKLAETAVVLSEHKFEDLLRTLHYSLRSSYFELYYLQRSVGSYDKQVNALEKLSTAYAELAQKGIVTVKDAIRIKSLLYSLKAEQTSLQNQLNEQQAALQILLQSNKAYFIAEADSIPVTDAIDKYSLAALIDTAYANRYDLRMAQHTVLYNQQYYTLQKALAKPDLTIGAEFDKRGSFVDNASFLTVAMDLPFFKRNQGNIRAAKFSIDQSKVLMDQQQQTVENEVELAYSKLLNTDKMLKSVDPSFESQLDKLLGGITENFQKKNLSLIEFTDFNESYKNNILQLNQMRNDRQQAIEALQFAVGKNLFN